MSKGNLKNKKTNFIRLLENKLNTSKKSEKIAEYTRIVNLWKTNSDSDLFIMAIYLIKIKEDIINKVKKTMNSKVINYDKLSLKYDNESSLTAFDARVTSCIYSKEIIKDLLNNKESKKIVSLSKEEQLNLYKLIKKFPKIDLESCFMPIILESINQGITSNAGSSYEDRIYDKLIEIGIHKSNITEYGHSEVGSVEHDFIFKYKNKLIGISAKRTLRERYKQYVNLAENTETDYMIAITLGTDLTINKAKTIVHFGVKLFIAPEIYKNNKDLQKIDGVYPTTKFNKKTFDKIIKSN